MIIKKTSFDGVVEIQLKPHYDHRGYFMRTYDEEVLKDYSGVTEWVQENQSYTKLKNSIRGLHFQLAPYSETKLVRPVSGTVYMVVLDLRLNSPTFGDWEGYELSSRKKNALIVKKGFALGMATRTNNCILLYKMANWYRPEYQACIRWNDKELAINWGINNPIISEKDSSGLSFREYVASHGGISV